MLFCQNLLLVLNNFDTSFLSSSHGAETQLFLPQSFGMNTLIFLIMHELEELSPALDNHR